MTCRQTAIFFSCLTFILLLPLLSFNVAGLGSAFLHSTKGCNRTIRNSIGWIRWTGRMGRCVIQIKAPLKDPQVIEMRIRRMQVGILKNARCNGAYVQFFNKLDDLDENAGRYCGHIIGNTTRLFLRRGSDLAILLDSESHFAAENPVIFSAQFSILPARLVNERHHVHRQHQQHQLELQALTSSSSPSSSTTASSVVGECPLECLQRNDRLTCRLFSPGYPGIYPRGIQCRVNLQSRMGRFRLGGSPDDLYNLMNHTNQEACSSEFCEQEHVQADEPSLQHNQLRTKFNERDEEDETIIAQEKLRIASESSKVKLRKQSKRLKDKKHRQKELRSKADGDELDKSNGFRYYEGELENSGVRESSINKSRQRFNFDHEESLLKFDRNGNYHLGNELTNKSRSDSKPGSFPSPSSSNFPSKEPVVVVGRAGSCVGDYLVLFEMVKQRLLEIGKFCGKGRIPAILSRGSNVVIEFHTRRDGTIMHDGFHLNIQESQVAEAKGSLGPESKHDGQPDCDFVYRSAEQPRDSLRSLHSWYPAGTLCSYRFVARPAERVSVHLRIVRDSESKENNREHKDDNVERITRHEDDNDLASRCPGNEIAVYNSSETTGGSILWSFCDVLHRDINNIQVPILSTGNSLLIQFHSAVGSYSGLDFTYSITYKFVKKPDRWTIRRRQVSSDETQVISLKPVDMSTLDLSEQRSNCKCSLSDRIGNFKSWFILLMVLGVTSFIGAIVTIVALLVKCAKLKKTENKLLQTPNRSITYYYNGTTD